jgi:membrane peptidoglycan carboxypeptidase
MSPADYDDASYDDESNNDDAPRPEKTSHPDESNHADVPLENDAPPVQNEAENIHKALTEDFVFPENVVSDEDTAPRDATKGIILPLELKGPLKDEESWDEDDVPFHLPHSDDIPPSSDAPIGSKFITMPNRSIDEGGTAPPQVTIPSPRQPSPQSPRPTKPGMQRLPTQAQPEQQRYQRPAYQAPPQQQVQQPGRRPPPQAQAKDDKNHQRLPRRRPRRRKLSNAGCLALFIGVFLTFCGGITLISVAGGVYGYVRVGQLLNEKIDPIDDYTNFQSTFLYDRNGESLYEIFGEGRRTNVNLAQIPQALIDATIAIEDDSFYSNIGVDIPATVLAFLRFVGAEPDEQTAGGSTITQQLVRNVLFDADYRAERSAQRKVEEILLAITLNTRQSKDEILELYLNEIYYGNLAYGAQAAAHVIFDKDVSELTLGESALLAGLPQAPAELDPLNSDPTVQATVEIRWRQVLNEMVEEDYITDAERGQALAEGLQFASPDVPLNAPHFTVYAQGQLETLMRDLGYSPDEIARGGLHVYTTVDLRLNEIAQGVARNQVLTLAGHNISNAAVIVTKPLTGEIMAMVGSIDYHNEAIDGHVNVTTAFRQPGSTMKPFTYSAAMEAGMTPGDVIWDTRTSIGIPGQPAYVPRNYDGAFHGPVILRYALANSFNIPAVQTLRSMGPNGVQYLLDMMARFGVDSLGREASDYGLSLTLGGGEISPLELTRAYSVFANNGVLVDTTAILCILDNDNNIIYQYEDGCPRGDLIQDSVVRVGLGMQMLDPRIAFFISDVLGDNSSRTPAMGSNSDLYTPGIATSVKTGTTNDVKDNWTVGYTRNVAIGVWVGNNNGDPMVNSSGLTGAAPIWNRVMTTIYNDGNLLGEFAVNGQLQNDQRQAPAGMSQRQICNVRAMQDPTTACPSMIVEWFLDSPAGLPDGAGGLYYPPPTNAPAPPIPASGSYVQEYSPGVFRTVVFPLDSAVANAIQFNVAPGQRPPPPPRYCRVPVELIGTTPGIQEQLFIVPPSIPEDAIEAEEYARSHNLAFLPTIDCSPGLLTAAPVSSEFPDPGGGTFPATRFAAMITSPTANQFISGPTAIMGTADFPSDQAQYYVFEIKGGPYGEWTRIQESHSASVVGGQLETLYPPAQSGNYLLRLLIIDWNHNIAQQPYIVPFIVP